jgi:HPr kinase/phosphorylase
MTASLNIHATTIAVGGRALVILGPSGSGKSALALALIGMGAGLIADDRTILTRRDDALVAGCPPQIAGMIEARGLGLIRCPAHPPCPVALVADLSLTETARLPPPRSIVLLDVTLPVVHKVDSPHFPAGLRLYLEHGRYMP